MAAAELGIQRSEVNTRVRFVREAGHLRSGPRGRHAPHMDAADLSACLLALVDPVDPTRSGDGLREMIRAAFRGCVWRNLDAAERQIAGGPPLPERWYPAPLSPAYGDALSPADPRACLAALLAAIVANPALCSLRVVHRASDADGVTLEFTHEEHARPAAMAGRLVAYTGDRSDAFGFPAEHGPERWEITARFVIREPQADRRRHVIELPGAPVARLARAVLGGADA